MRVAINSVLAASGYLPASMLARLLGKQVTTLHRLAKAGRVVASRDGRALYLSARSLSDYYRAGQAGVVADAILELMMRTQEEVRARDTALAEGLQVEKSKAVVEKLLNRTRKRAGLKTTDRVPSPADIGKTTKTALEKRMRTKDLANVD